MSPSELCALEAVSDDSIGHSLDRGWGDCNIGAPWEGYGPEDMDKLLNALAIRIVPSKRYYRRVVLTALGRRARNAEVLAMA